MVDTLSLCAGDHLWRVYSNLAGNVSMEEWVVLHTSPKDDDSSGSAWITRDEWEYYGEKEVLRISEEDEWAANELFSNKQEAREKACSMLESQLEELQEESRENSKRQITVRRSMADLRAIINGCGE